MVDVGVAVGVALGCVSGRGLAMCVCDGKVGVSTRVGKVKFAHCGNANVMFETPTGDMSG